MKSRFVLLGLVLVLGLSLFTQACDQGGGSSVQEEKALLQSEWVI